MMSTATTGNSQYTKARTEKATIAESNALAQAAAAPAIRGAGFAVLLSSIAVFVAFVALIVAIVK